MTLSARQILMNMELAQIPDGDPWHGARNAFVIGCLDKVRITLCAQQIRALNLVYALVAERRLTSGTRMAVIGAGAAGLTCAQAALQVGARVRVFEREAEPLAVFAPEGVRKGKGRHVRPFLADWPAPNWFEPDAGLPVGNWTAGDSTTVADQLRVGLAKAIEKTTRPCRTSISYRRGSHRPWHVSYQQPGAEPSSYDADVLVLAMGFGRDQRPSDDSLGTRPTPSYWEGLPRVLSDTKDVWVAGDGDGALTDAVSFAFHCSDEDPYLRALSLVHEWMRDKSHLETLAALEVIEHEVRRGALDGIELNRRYTSLLKNRRHSVAISRLNVLLTDRTEVRRRVHLLTRGPGRFNPRTFGVNRLLLWRGFESLSEAGRARHPRISWHLGSFDKSASMGPRAPAERRFIRYGPEWLFQKTYETISKSAQKLEHRNELDLTRIQAWPSGFYRESRSATVKRAPFSIKRLSIFANIEVSADRLTHTRYTVRYEFGAAQPPGAFKMEHQVTTGEPFRLRLAHMEPTESVRELPLPDAWMVAYEVTPSASPVTIELIGAPDGGAWMSDALGFPVYENMAVDEILVRVRVEPPWRAFELRPHIALLMRRDRSEVSGEAIRGLCQRQRLGHAWRFRGVRGKPLPTGYFFGVHWDRLGSRKSVDE